MHSKTQQAVAMQVGSRNKQTAEKLFYKLLEPLKKKPDIILTTSQSTTRPFFTDNIDPSAKNLVRHHTLKDLIAPSDSMFKTGEKDSIILQEVGESHRHDCLFHMRV